MELYLSSRLKPCVGHAHYTVPLVLRGLGACSDFVAVDERLSPELVMSSAGSSSRYDLVGVIENFAKIINYITEDMEPTGTVLCGEVCSCN